MITGTISARRAYIGLIVRGSSGQEGEVEFVLDTGFTASITLPPAACTLLGLRLLGHHPARLADRSRVFLDVYQATVLWDGSERVIRVLAMDGAPLVGMTLLDGHEVRLQVVEGGTVTIDSL
jgi:clan AA aspartic protease